MGGWVFEPWDTSFYPAGLSKKRQLEFASRQVPTIEVNGTYRRGQKPETFAKWAAEAPDGFVFSLKGHMAVTNKKVLAEAGESMAMFFAQGITELGDKLGPILWQFMGTKQFDPADFEAFLQLLPDKRDGISLRHAVEVRHETFVVPEFVALAARYNVAIVYADHAEYPAIADVTGDFVYVRLQTGSDEHPACYDEEALDGWARRAGIWSQGGDPDDLAHADAARKPVARPRDVFVYFITNGKARAPFGARSLMQRAGKASPSPE